MDAIDRILNRHPSADPPADLADATADAVEHARCCGLLRGVRERAAMLEFRKRTGDVLAVSYGWIDHAMFQPGVGIRIHAGGNDVLIAGRNLVREVAPGLTLFAAICRHRCTYIAETPTAERFAEADVVIEAIRW